jgi:hypothetical protein
VKLFGRLVRQSFMSDRIVAAAWELRVATEAVVRACIDRKNLDLQRARDWAEAARDELRAEVWAAAVMQPVAGLASEARRR